MVIFRRKSFICTCRRIKTFRIPVWRTFSAILFQWRNGLNGATDVIPAKKIPRTIIQNNLQIYWFNDLFMSKLHLSIYYIIISEWEKKLYTYDTTKTYIKLLLWMIKIGILVFITYIKDNNKNWMVNLYKSTILFFSKKIARLYKS